jgi:adenylyltransferase/sulfurtransferase
VALYLAAAGVGRLGIVDDDAVDLTNLQRQVMFGTSDVGKPKIDAATARIRDLNPNVTVIPHRVRLTRENALDVVSGYDIVVDGSDNFPTRYLVNDACAVLGKPDVYGSVFRFEGQASVFGLEDGPCYRCLYPEPSPPALVPSCAEAGVLGVVPGIIGSIQAAETIKLIIRRGEVLKGRLLLFDALEMKFRELKVPKNPACPVCRPQRTTRELPDYEEFCRAGGASSAGSSATPEITPRELKACLDAGGDSLIIDVREPYENRICRLDALLIPLAEIPSRLDDLDRSRDIVVYCRTGIRSAAAVAFLKQAGFARVWNLRGGILAWADEIDPTMPKY